MTQPELGTRIVELRVQRRMTQKELADLCNVDIRTIQRIENGEVVPRMYTLKLLSAALGHDLNQSGGKTANDLRSAYSNPGSPVIAGMIFSANSVPVVFYLITGSPNSLFYFLSMTIHIISSIFFFKGFYFLGKRSGNAVISVSSLIAMILLPLTNMEELFKNYLFGTAFFQSLTIAPVIFTLLCINAVVFGVGLLIEAYRKKALYKINLYTISGVLTIIQSVLFLSIDLTIAGVGLVISIATNILMTIILYREYKNQEKGSIRSLEQAALA